MEVTKNVFLFTYVISSAEIKGLQPNDLASAVEITFGKLPKEEKNELVRILEEKLEKSKIRTMMI